MTNIFVKILCLFLNQKLLNVLSNILSEASRAKKWQLIIKNIKKNTASKNRSTK